MPTLEKWLLATVIGLLVGAWHAADAALRDRAARKPLPPPPGRRRRCRRTARLSRRWSRHLPQAAGGGR